MACINLPGSTHSGAVTGLSYHRPEEVALSGAPARLHRLMHRADAGLTVQPKPTCQWHRFDSYPPPLCEDLHPFAMSRVSRFALFSVPRLARFRVAHRRVSAADTADGVEGRDYAAKAGLLRPAPLAPAEPDWRQRALRATSPGMAVPRARIRARNPAQHLAVKVAWMA